MRCSEAKRRLDEFRLDGSRLTADADLAEHLRVCPACARQAAALRRIQRDIAAIRTDSLEEGAPFSFVKSRIEATVAAASGTDKEFSIMTALSNGLRNHRRLPVTVGIVAVLAAFLLLIPFTFERTVGYQVAVAGVNKDLAENNEQVKALLLELGLEGAEVDVTGCQETCNLVISGLHSEGDAELVQAAFTADENGTVNCVVKPVVVNESGSLLKHVKLKYQYRIKTSGLDDADVHDVLVEKLGEECGGNALMWMQCQIDSSNQLADFDFICDSAMFAGNGDSICRVIMIQGDGSGQVGGLLQNLNLEGDDIDEQILQQLRDMGCDVTIEESENGTKKEIRVKCGNLQGTSDGDGDDAGAAKEASESDLPDGYSLDQNYPNPFNPTTNITFSLPQPEQVTLEIYNIQGQKVRTLIDEVRTAGMHTVEWDATNNNGDKVASGVYFYRLNAGDISASRKMTLLK